MYESAAQALLVGRVREVEDIAAIALLILITNPYTMGTVINVDTGSRLVQ